MLPSQMISFQQPTLILFGLGKYIHLRVVDNYNQMFRNTNFKPNVILALLPERTILGKTQMVVIFAALNLSVNIQ